MTPVRWTVVFLLFLVAFSVRANGKDKGWTEVRSPHFRVLTDGTAGDGRRVANEFEQIREVFASEFPNLRLETGSPLLIFAPRDEASTPGQQNCDETPGVEGFLACRRRRTTRIPIIGALLTVPNAQAEASSVRASTS